MASARTLVLGSEEKCCPDIKDVLTSVLGDGFDFIAVPLVHPRNRRDSNSKGISKGRDAAFTKSDLLLQSSNWTRSIVGKVSEWLWPALESVGENGEMSSIRRSSEDALKQELAWASHLSLPAVMFPQLPCGDCFNTCRLINQCVQQMPYYQVWVTVPLVNWNENETLQGNNDSPWSRWNKLRILCEHSPALFVALELGADLPDSFTISQWEAEPVKVLLLPTSCFINNKKGFPVLSKKHQAVVKKFAKFNVQIMVTGRARHPNGRIVYQQYLRHIWAESMGVFSEEEQTESPYLDYLQAPLQPLMDNLESQTYETFEKDPVKYEQYRKAVALALIDLVNAKHAPDISLAQPGQLVVAPSREARELCVTLMVVGAGRGPLVRASLMATREVSESLKELTKNTLTINLTVFAVEKNPNAVVTLRALVVAERWTNVTVVSEDMRKWKPPNNEKADIMVSELLGSFGDNELSPECLDGAQYFLKDGGVSIPQDYTSYIAPLAAAKLWNDAKHSKTLETELKALETPYVVKIHNGLPLAAPELMFTFEHPNVDFPDHIDNSRYKTLRFTFERGGTIHGLVGYFESKLYGDVYISILPDSPNFSHGMFSWFPLYFPLRHPIYAEAGEVIDVHMWRATSASKVWYEWSLNTPHHSSTIHNPNGRSYWIGL